jgi:hypothetical protein
MKKTKPTKTAAQNNANATPSTLLNSYLLSLAISVHGFEESQL